MPAPEHPRASPEALLELARKEGRGRLKIFLGAAPGVGKTYAMLQAGRAARADGVDVAVGLVETHGRRETEALLEGLEVVPRLSVPHRGRMVREFDLDAALERRPQLVLLDEYAHTNAPGSRHPKRWQDARELLAAGIDVWTTLNVQHLEGLNDVVQRITRVRVRETVPDSVFDEADEIVLVDLPPDELLKRLAEGKVYVRDTAARAADHFFRANNLVALRELALRRAAERVDSDLLGRMRGGAIEGPWAAGERILVCVGADATAPAVVRHAKRQADLMGAPLLAVTVDRPGERRGEAARRRVDAALRLAEGLGARTRTLVGTDLVEELLRFAKFENVTQIVVGRSRGGWVAEALGRSLPHRLVRRADDIAVHVVTPPRAAAPGGLRARLAGGAFGAGGARPRGGSGPPYLWSTAAVALAVLVGRGMTALVTLPNVSMLFLLAIVFSAIRFGVWPAIFTSLLSFLAYNFFIEPFYALTVARPHEVLALLIFLAIAILTSAIAGRARDQASAAVARARANRRLYEFARRLSGLAEPQAVAEGAAVELHGALKRPAVILLPGRAGGDLAIAATWPPEDELDAAAMSAARWAFERGEPAGADTATLPTVPWYFVPLSVPPEGRAGAVGVADEADGVPLDPEARALLETVAELTATALERSRLAREIQATRAAAESERVRNTLLASISHDFRTPLASILGAASSLVEYGPRLPEASRRDLLEQVRDEAGQLDRMVRNLLAMTRVEAGALEIRRDWVDLREAMDRAVAAARRRGAGQRFEVRVEGGLPFVSADPTLLDQALGNLVGNAVRHAGPDAAVTLEARREGPDRVLVTVTDDGPGVPPELLPAVFDKFVRGRPPAGDGGQGSGLGLAIAKGIAEAHGGAIAAESPVAAGRGFRVGLRLPAPPAGAGAGAGLAAADAAAAGAGAAAA